MLGIDFTGVHPRDNFARGLSIFKDKVKVKEKEKKKEEWFCI